MALSQNTTRGMSFDPVVARVQRETQKAAASASVPVPDSVPQPQYGTLDGSKKQFGKYLDEVNTAWRERSRDRRSP